MARSEKFYLRVDASVGAAFLYMLQHLHQGDDAGVEACLNILNDAGFAINFVPVPKPRKSKAAQGAPKVRNRAATKTRSRPATV
jgi:hypothetical protein